MLSQRIENGQIRLGVNSNIETIKEHSCRLVFGYLSSRVFLPFKRHFLQLFTVRKLFSMAKFNNRLKRQYRSKTHCYIAVYISPTCLVLFVQVWFM